MPIDKFGKASSRNKGLIQPNAFRKPVGYILTSDGHLNMENRRIKNIGAPTDDNDAVSKVTLESEMNHHKEFVNEAVIKVVNTLITRQGDIYDLLIRQEGKIRDVINERCNLLEKQIKAEFHDEIASIHSDISTLRKQLSDLDQHVKQLHPLMNKNTSLPESELFDISKDEPGGPGGKRKKKVLEPPALEPSSSSSSSSAAAADPAIVGKSKQTEGNGRNENVGKDNPDYW